MKDYSDWCSILNLISFIIMFVISIIMIINIFKMIVVRILLIILFYFLCGYFEQYILSKYINSFVEYLLNKKK